MGCSACAKTGYKGRVALHEVMRVSETIERHTVDRVSAAVIGETARAEGMATLRMDGWLKVIDGVTSIDLGPFVCPTGPGHCTVPRADQGTRCGRSAMSA